MSEEIKSMVKERYTEIVSTGSSCCGPSCCGGEQENAIAEDYSTLEGYDEGADLGLGCGIPTQFARIDQGDTVLDLGSGAGNDVFVARSLTGPEGKVIGLDMTAAMVEKANQNKSRLGYDNVYFIHGDIESIPLPEAQADVVLSNCVMNLVPDKLKAFKEVFRVLKNDGHFSISDIVLEGDFPESLKKVAELYTGCVSGAIGKEDYLDTIRQAGFSNVKIDQAKPYTIPVDLLEKHLDGDTLAAYQNGEIKILSINVYGEKGG